MLGSCIGALQLRNLESPRIRVGTTSRVGRRSLSCEGKNGKKITRVCRADWPQLDEIETMRGSSNAMTNMIFGLIWVISNFDCTRCSFLHHKLRIKDCQHGNVMRFSPNMSPPYREVWWNPRIRCLRLCCRIANGNAFSNSLDGFLSWWTEVDFEQTLFGRSYETGTDCDNQLKWCLKKKRNAALGQLLVVFWCDIFKNQSKVWLFFSRPFWHHLPPPQPINRRLSLIERNHQRIGPCSSAGLLWGTTSRAGAMARDEQKASHAKP